MIINGSLIEKGKLGIIGVLVGVGVLVVVGVLVAVGVDKPGSFTRLYSNTAWFLKVWIVISDACTIVEEGMSSIVFIPGASSFWNVIISASRATCAAAASVIAAGMLAVCTRASKPCISPGCSRIPAGGVIKIILPAGIACVVVKLSL